MLISTLALTIRPSLSDSETGQVMVQRRLENDAAASSNQQARGTR